MKSSATIFIAATLLLSPGLSLAQTWTAPTQTAPAGNASAPLNVSSADQVKAGGVSMGSLIVTGNAALTGANSIFTIGGTPFRASALRTLSIGTEAGLSTPSIADSIFLGYRAGKMATGSDHSNFIGMDAGMNATYAPYSNFLGNNAGSGATQATASEFIGSGAGMGATNANNSIFIGFSAGLGDIVNNSGGGGKHSILIGDQTSTGGFSNSIAIGSFARNTAADQLNVGRVLYATGIASTSAASNAGPIAGGKVGIGVESPTATLDVAGSVKGTSVCIGSDCRTAWPAGGTTPLTNSSGYWSEEASDFTVQPFSQNGINGSLNAPDGYYVCGIALRANCDHYSSENACIRARFCPFNPAGPGTSFFYP